MNKNSLALKPSVSQNGDLSVASRQSKVVKEPIFETEAMKTKREQEVIKKMVKPLVPPAGF
jgi:hypothetical protein